MESSRKIGQGFGFGQADPSLHLSVAVSALSAKSYGGDAYIRSIVPAFDRYAPEVAITLLTQDDRYDALCSGTKNVKVWRVVEGAHLGGMRRIFWEQFSLPRLLRHTEFDLLFTGTNTGPLWCPIPVVISVRNMEPLVPVALGTALKHQIRHTLLAQLTVLSSQRARCVVPVSQYVQQTLEGRGISPEKCDVVYHGIDDLAEPPPEEVRAPGGGYVFAAAKFIRYANIDTLFRSFAELRRLGYQGELRFAGGPYDQVYEAEVRRLADELGVTPFIRYLGYIPRAEVHALLRRCDLFLFSSTLEACPFSLLEGMRQGAAIIATTAQPMPEFCADAAICLPAKDFEAIGQAAYRIVTDESWRQELKTRSLNRARAFTWERTVRGLVACWGRAVRG